MNKKGPNPSAWARKGLKKLLDILHEREDVREKEIFYSDIQCERVTIQIKS